ncbi:MAG: hypothetical protein ACRDPY_41270 [Streptosporangiaceae bacterium]
MIHLAGASLAGRFSPTHKREIRGSRITPTRRLAELAAASGGARNLRAFVTASAIGIYGPERKDEVLTEDSPGGEGFLAPTWSGRSPSIPGSSSITSAPIRCSPGCSPSWG